jgi:hypothetical protein
MSATRSTVPPLVQAGLDLRSFPDMPLGVARLRDSDLVSFASDKAFRSAVLLWCVAWHQVPASSLPADDRQLARYAGFGQDVKGWAKIKADAMRGFVLCSDGRFYHNVIAEKAVEADNRRRAFRERTANATARRLANQRNEERNDQRNVPHDADRYVDEVKGREGKIREGNKKVDADAGGREPLVSEQAFSLAVELATLAGYPDPKAWPPGWCGAPMRVQAWLNEGWPAEIMLIAVRSTMAKMGTRAVPPKSVQFFEEAIAREIARQRKPVTKVSVIEGEVLHVSENSDAYPGGDFGRRRDRAREAHAALGRRVAEAEREAREGRGSGEPSVEILPPVGRG